MPEIGEYQPQLQAPAPTPEIKPAPGSLSKVLTAKEKPAKPPVKYLVVFGQGPVIDQDTLEKPDPGKANVTEGGTFWLRSVARAAGELYIAGETEKILLTGGKTGGPKLKSEAELMRDVLVNEYKVPEEDIMIEDRAVNTLENFALSLNMIDSQRPYSLKGGDVGLLGADFHLSRIRLLAKLFGVNADKAYSAQQIFRLIAQRTDDQEMLLLLNSQLNPNEDLSQPDSRIDWNNLSNESPKSALKAPTFFEQRTGKERSGIIEKMLESNWFGYGLLDVPRYWIGYAGYIQDNQRLMGILDQFEKSDPGELKKLGVFLNQNPDIIRKKLIKYTRAPQRTMPPQFQEARTVWTDNAKAKLEQVVARK